MKGKVVLGAFVAIAATAGGTALASTVHTSPANNTVTSADCGWVSNDGDTNLIVVIEGSDDCTSAFQIISGTGLNWNTTNPRVNNGSLECRLSNGAEYLWVYELDIVDVPLTSDSGSLCGSLEQAGWTP